MSRRTLIIGSSLVGTAAGVGGWALLANLRLVPGRDLLDGALGRCDLAGSPPPQAEPGRLVVGSFYSTHRRRSVSYALAYPPKVTAGASLPVCLVLHGLGGDERSAFDEIGYHQMLAAAVAAKVPPFVLAAVDGGAACWHPHASGDDPLGLVLEGFPVVLRQHGLPTDRLGVLGWSVGGYGALLAAVQAPERFVAVVANAPAIWRSFDEARAANATAFDSAEEWSHYGDLLPRADRLTGVPLRIDCGESDPFAPVVSDLRDRLNDPGAVHLAPGCHDVAFWRSVASEQLHFIGTALTPSKQT